MAHITKVKHNELTPIQEFYANGTVFVTGGTGFLGKSEFVSEDIF